MEILELSLRSSNQFINDFNEEKLENELFFDYNVHSKEVFKNRAADLKNRSFQREELSTYLEKYTKRFSDSNEKTLENIERLKDPNSVVIIGGQQAGLLSGPLYTIHKIISIIVLAKQQEDALGIPVIPVFWIAGEDHDFAEINHIYATKNDSLKKLAIKDSPHKKLPVADLPLNHEKTLEWIEDVFEAFGETDHSNLLLNQLKNHVKNSLSYVDFFEFVIMDLFKNEGLVIINSGDSKLRQLERSCFQSIIDVNSSLYEAVVLQQHKMRSCNYKPIIEMPQNSANLFYHYNGERYLIERITNDEYQVPGVGVTFTKSELITMIEDQPHMFSNNVVTRPIMQEFLFPTLAFIAGPGELTYWAELKHAFALMEIKMPPVLPRFSITLLERSIERNIKETNLSLEEVLKNGVEDSITNFLKAVSPVDMESLVNEAKSQISEIHEKLISAAVQVDHSLEPMLRKNGMFIQDQLNFLHQVVEKRMHQQHEVQLIKYKSIELSLVPNFQPQERVLNIFYFLNKIGPFFVRDLLNLSYSYNSKHKIVKI